ncbi:hypothetical protein [Parasitella parasitica]|uniref:Uncharacterized protein n=1 Tax=Parasitella parasitica TaxID=35722 RepID=A0A0B7NX99_9FUNG|nr:hypothetical protein [Parasitella parasitica]
MRCLHPTRIFAGELRSIITVLYILMLVMQTSWDAVSTWIKYTEKFMAVPSTGQIISKPFTYWSPEHQSVAQAMDYVECVNLSMQTGVFFLLQCFWNYLSNTVAKKSFMGSWEFKFYIFWALGSVAVFPVLQWFYRNDEHLRETAPQLAYSIEGESCIKNVKEEPLILIYGTHPHTKVLITSLLGIRSNRRFRRILNISCNLKHGGTAIAEKLAYFKDMNIYLTIVLFFYAMSLGILCIDGLTAAKTINSNKFASDLLIANCNTASVLMWIIGISIFHPRRSNAEIEASVRSRSVTTGHTTTQGRSHAQQSDTDVETNHYHHQKGSSNRFNGSESINKNNSYRQSQRIANFIESKNAGTLRFDSSAVVLNDGSKLYEPTAKELMNSSNGSFLRPMSPVQVDKPSVVDDQHTFTPTNYFAAAAAAANCNISFSDPYSHHAVNFTMLDPVSDSKKFQDPSLVGRESYEASSSYRSTSPRSNHHQHHQDYPMQNISGAAISRHYHDNDGDHFKLDPSIDHHTSDYLPQTPTNAKPSDYF